MQFSRARRRISRQDYAHDGIVPRSDREDCLLDAGHAKRHRRVSLALASHATASLNASRRSCARSRATRMLFDDRRIGESTGAASWRVASRRLHLGGGAGAGDDDDDDDAAQVAEVDAALDEAMRFDAEDDLIGAIRAALPSGQLKSVAKRIRLERMMRRVGAVSKPLPAPAMPALPPPAAAGAGGAPRALPDFSKLMGGAATAPRALPDFSKLTGGKPSRAAAPAPAPPEVDRPAPKIASGDARDGGGGLAKRKPSVLVTQTAKRSIHARGNRSMMSRLFKTFTPADEDEAPEPVSRAAGEASAGPSLHDWIESVGMGPYASAIAELAESPEDLSEIEEEDVDALLREEHVPKLKARRFRRALRELGANVNAQ